MGIIVAPLHGGVASENKTRAELSKALREGRVGIIVATEMAAWGTDAPLLTHVINLDLPTDSSHYVHSELFLFGSSPFLVCVQHCVFKSGVLLQI